MTAPRARLQMSALVAATCGIGFLASWAMLQLGLASMWLRYPLAAAVAYAAFLALVGLWVHVEARALRASAPVPNAPASRDTVSLFDGVPWIPLDGEAWPVAAVVLAAVLLGGAIVYVVYVAPTLLAELLLDVGIAAGLYGRIARGDPRRWLWTAMHATLPAAVLTTLMLAVVGAALGQVAPEASSIGPVIQHLTRHLP